MSNFAAEEKNFGFKLPDGFEATLFAGDDLAHDIFSMTLDAQGRVVVSGPGYVKILPDNGNGKCDHAGGNGWFQPLAQPRGFCLAV